MNIPDNLKRYICQLEQANAKLRDFIENENLQDVCENLDSRQSRKYGNKIENLLAETKVTL